MSSHDLTSFLPENPPPLPPSTPPLPPSAPSTSHTMYGSPQLQQSMTQPPNMNQMSAVAYQQYYQQYMQYVYSMYGASAAQTAAYSYNMAAAKQTVETAPQTTTPTIVTVNRPAETVQQKPAIKFNLKFQTQPKVEQQQPLQIETAGRKSRFNNNSLANIQAEQESFKKKEAEDNKVSEPTVVKQEEPIAAGATTTTAADIVADINKWPATLKAYCTKVYQFYQKLHTVSEDQVTKYLQQRITDTFKLKPDLNIDWDNEKIPDVSAIRLVAPFSHLQLQQQKRQQKMHEAALVAAKAKAAEILAQKEKLKQQLAETKKITTLNTSSLAAEISKNKRKYSSRSRSASSDSSSTSSTSSHERKSNDFIQLSTKKPKTKHPMMKIEKKKLKNIQVNSVNGKKSFVVVDQINKRKSSDETSDGEEDEGDESDDENSENNDKSDLQTQQQKLLTTPNKFLSNKQKKIKANLINRQKRFQNELKNNKKHIINRQTRTLFSSINRDSASEEADMNEVVIGQNQDLEKEYLRLTGPPEPAMVRPISVLKKSLIYVLDKYSKSNDYRYICDQMKAIRQDLTVQMIQNEFTIEVYETHARIAIKNKDRDEFNQCQSQLKNLYILTEKNGLENNSAEFIGYRLLYNMLTKSHNDLNQVIKEIKRKYSSIHYLNHLLALRNAWHLSNYVKFFRIYKQCNELSKCLIDLFIERERKLALKIIIKAYRPSIKLECVKEMLAYESLQKCKDDLIAYKLIIQSVPLSSDTNSTTTTSSSTKSSLLNNSKSTGFNSKFNLNTTKQQFEEVLDCKTCPQAF